MTLGEVYCLICGGPVDLDPFNNPNIIDYYIGWKKIKQGYKRKEIDLLKYYTKDEYIKLNKKIATIGKRLKWCKKVMLISRENEIIRNPIESEYGLYYKNNKFYSIRYIFDDDKYIKSILCHIDCYNLLNKTLKYNLKYEHVCRLIDDYFNVLKTTSKYGKVMNKYSFWLNFNWSKLLIKDYLNTKKIMNNIEINTEDLFIVESPLKNSKNKNRILKMWRPLVKKFAKAKIRNSPCESATIFKIGTVLKGSDKKEYVVKKMGKTKKWEKK